MTVANLFAAGPTVVSQRAQSKPQESGVIINAT